MGGRGTGGDAGHTGRSDTQNHKTRHSANGAATLPERTSLVTRSRTGRAPTRVAGSLGAQSRVPPARHPDAQGARVERQAARGDWLQSRRPPGRGMMWAACLKGRGGGDAVASKPGCQRWPLTSEEL